MADGTFGKRCPSDRPVANVAETLEEPVEADVACTLLVIALADCLDAKLLTRLIAQEVMLTDLRLEATRICCSLSPEIHLSAARETALKCAGPVSSFCGLERDCTETATSDRALALLLLEEKVGTIGVEAREAGLDIAAIGGEGTEMTGLSI